MALDMQTALDMVSDMSYHDRSIVHLTYGRLVSFLKGLEPEALDSLEVVANRIGDHNAEDLPVAANAGSYRGFYEDMHLSWNASHRKTTAREMLNYLESIEGEIFSGWKGGDYPVKDDRPLWLATDYGHCSRLAVLEVSASPSKVILWFKLLDY